MSCEKLEFFIGPCVLESRELVFEMADFLTRELAPLKDKITWSFKGSFDKANRSSASSYRGPGLEKGLDLLSQVKEKYHLPVITDFHLPEQASKVAEVVDVLQVPAFLCRQSDMIFEGAKACAQLGRRLKIKKGQFLSPYETQQIVTKASEYLSADKVLLTERGTTFGYNNLVVDMTSFSIMKQTGAKVIHDATHCVQMPGSLGHGTGGKREHILTLAKAAIAAGAQGVFMEAHPEPARAKSDAATSLPLKDIPQIVKTLLRLYEVASC